MTDFLKIAKSIVVHFAHICAYSVETVKPCYFKYSRTLCQEIEVIYPAHAVRVGYM